MKKSIKIKVLLVGFVFFIAVFCFGIYKFKSQNNDLKNYNISIEDSNIKKEYELFSYVTEDIKSNSIQSICSLSMAYEYTPDKMYELSSDIAIVKIISKDYMDPNASMLGMTFGKLLVNNIIKGNLEEGEVVEYQKPGGYIDLKTYDESRPEASREKRRFLREQAGITNDMSNEYINILADSDIEIEVGKTYLVYLTYNTYTNAYEIIGLGNGLREVNIPQENKKVKMSEENIENLKIKNNQTGEWEDLYEYIEENIKKINS